MGSACSASAQPSRGTRATVRSPVAPSCYRARGTRNVASRADAGAAVGREPRPPPGGRLAVAAGHGRPARQARDRLAGSATARRRLLRERCAPVGVPRPGGVAPHQQDRAGGGAQQPVGDAAANEARRPPGAVRAEGNRAGLDLLGDRGDRLGHRAAERPPLRREAAVLQLRNQPIEIMLRVPERRRVAARRGRIAPRERRDDHAQQQQLGGERPGALRRGRQRRDPFRRAIRRNDDRFAAPSAGCPRVALISSSGTVVPASTASATLGWVSRSSPPRACVAITIRSAARSRACATIAAGIALACSAQGGTCSVAGHAMLRPARGSGGDGVAAAARSWARATRSTRSRAPVAPAIWRASGRASSDSSLASIGTSTRSNIAFLPRVVPAAHISDRSSVTAPRCGPPLRQVNVGITAAGWHTVVASSACTPGDTGRNAAAPGGGGGFAGKEAAGAPAYPALRGPPGHGRLRQRARDRHRRRGPPSPPAALPVNRARPGGVSTMFIGRDFRISRN